MSDLRSFGFLVKKSQSNQDEVTSRKKVSTDESSDAWLLPTSVSLPSSPTSPTKARQRVKSKPSRKPNTAKHTIHDYFNDARKTRQTPEQDTSPVCVVRQCIPLTEAFAEVFTEFNDPLEDTLPGDDPAIEFTITQSTPERLVDTLPLREDLIRHSTPAAEVLSQLLVEFDDTYDSDTSDDDQEIEFIITQKDITDTYAGRRRKLADEDQDESNKRLSIRRSRDTANPANLSFFLFPKTSSVRSARSSERACKRQESRCIVRAMTVTEANNWLGDIIAELHG